MKTRLILLSLLAACVGSDKDESGGAKLQWYLGCGDPVCQGYTGPFEGVALCDDEVEGAACETEGETCDPVDDCNALLQCATEDPKKQTGGCPISLRRYKTDVAYLNAAERETLRQAVLSTRLARWRYKTAEPGSETRLGFLIDDQPGGSPAVLPDGQRVDLYGYTSMAVAALQAQQEEIAVLRAEIAALRARVEELER